MTNHSRDTQINTLRTLYLHIGLPKTASTWLQNKVFPRLDHLYYLNCPQNNLFFAGNNPEREMRVMGKVFKSASQIWADFGNTIFEEMIGDRLAWLSDGGDLLISEEMIGRQGSRPVLLAAHLHEMKRKSTEWGFDRFCIICMIRRQDHWLASHYAQISGQNPRASQSGFEGLARKITSVRESRYQFGMLLDYSVLYHHLAEVSGEKNLILLPYELLNESPHSFLQSLLTGLDTPADRIEEICNETSGTVANVRSKKGAWHLRQRRAKFAGLPLPRWLLNRRKKTIEVTPAIKDRIRKTYSAGNQKLDFRTSLNLDQFGYINFDE